MTALIEGMHYRIEFSYRRRAGKNSSLARNSPIAGVSCCAIVLDEFGDALPRHRIASPVVSVAAAVCAAGDNWSRARGRRLAFERAIYDCGILRKSEAAFHAWFDKRFPQRPAPARPPKFRLSLEEIGRRIEEGRARKAASS